MKLGLLEYGYYAVTVAPFTGAWIETVYAEGLCPLREVAPFTGAWIETSYKTTSPRDVIGRTLHGCVD